MTTIVKNMPSPRMKKGGIALPHTVAALAYEGLCTFEFGIVVELFGLPRPELDHWYNFEVCGLESGPLRAIGGLSVLPRKGLQALRRQAGRGTGESLACTLARVGASEIGPQTHSWSTRGPGAHEQTDLVSPLRRGDRHQSIGLDHNAANQTREGHVGEDCAVSRSYRGEMRDRL